MNPLTTYLWKEWREQRATLGVLAAVLFAGVAAIVAVLPAKHADDPLVFQGAIAIALLATIMSTGSDLLARERSGAGLGFLERTPAGLAMAFRAKLVFFTLTLFSAAAYGTLLATAAALLRCGELPQFLLDGPAPSLLAILLGVSLWVFAVSAWMPASALTFPGTVLLLAVLAWPAVLAMQGDPLYKPTPAQVLALVLLCIAGAPISAWLAFVLGSRRGRSRRWASIAGLSVAAIFFAPTWAWAAGRYSSLVNAPFEIQQGMTGLNGRFAFLVLTRRPPPGVALEASDRWDRPTALLVDLQRGSWSFPGPTDASGFISASWAQGRMLLREDELLEPVSLVRSGQKSARELAGDLFDRETGGRLPSDDPRIHRAPQIGPREFGLAVAPDRYTVRPAGAGQRLRYRADGRFIELYRDPDGRVFDASDLPRGERGAELFGIRPRRGRWIALDARTWVSLDPSSGEIGPLGWVQADEHVGPMLSDGRFLLVRDAQVDVLDPDSGQRTTLRLIGDPGFGLRFVVHHIGMLDSTLSASAPTAVLVSGAREMRLAVLDIQSGTLDLGPPNGGRRLEVLGCDARRALAIEDGERIVRYDLVRDEREVLFSIEEVH